MFLKVGLSRGTHRWPLGGGASLEGGSHPNREKSKKQTYNSNPRLEKGRHRKV